MHSTLRSVDFARILNCICIRNVSSLTSFIMTILQHAILFSKSTPPSYTYPMLVLIVRTHHNSHAMPPRAWSDHPCLIQPQFHHARPTTPGTHYSLFFKIPSSCWQYFFHRFTRREIWIHKRTIHGITAVFIRSLTAKFNKWTAESPTLLVIRFDGPQ